MEIDFSQEWTMILRRDGGTTPEPALFATEELARAAEELGGRAPSSGGDGADSDGAERLLVLDYGETGGARARPGGFSWRASPERVELYGDDPRSLLAATYDFLGELGFAWPYPGDEGRRAPPLGPVEFEKSSTSRGADQAGCTLILGHGAYLERWEEYMLWAARNGYSSVFFHTTDEALALGAAPAAAYEARRGDIAALARRLGLDIELGGHNLAALLPRRLFQSEPGLFRMADGGRRADGNLCPSNPRSLEIVSGELRTFALSHPEVSVFHVWPADLPGGGWCSCPDCAAARPSPAAQSLAVAIALAEALAAARPDARLSFLAYHDTERIDSALLSGLPGNLELLWAPRRRSWAVGLDEPGCALNAASASAFRAAAEAWRAAGGGAVSVFEYWEDAFLFKGAVPPRPAALSGDLAVYAPAEGGADRIGMLLTGGRLPLAPRPNPWLMPRLLSKDEPRKLMDSWIDLVYGPLSASMRGYWAALEGAWSTALDLEPGDVELHAVSRLGEAVDSPPEDWGDPRHASAERLGAMRERCEELFDELRRAEAALEKVRSSLPGPPGASAANADAGRGSPSPAELAAFSGEEDEYRITSSVLELGCARVAVYHELASGEARAAADLSLLAQAALGAFYAALAPLPDRRSRRELRFLAFLFYGLELRRIRRSATRNGLRRLFDRSLCLLLLAFRGARLRDTWKRAPERRRPPSGS